MLRVDVILPLALPRLLSYALPTSLAGQVFVGSLVIVPVRRKSYTAIVAAIVECADDDTLKPVTSVLPGEPIVRQSQLKLWRWLAQYYMCTAGEVAKAALPSIFKDEKKSAKHLEKVVDFQEITDDGLMAAPELSATQRNAISEIENHWRSKTVCLLHGVTSSGKTEIYIDLILKELAAGRQVLFLVPEIALTTQLTTRLGKVFGKRMGIWHSKFTDKRRMETWMRQLSNNPYPLILGVRSSIFLPFQNLGLVIVDEEHEQSYKQQDPAPRYNARDTAIVLATQMKAKVLLGSATPALESYNNAQTGKYGLVTVKERFGGVEMPEIVVEDMAELKRKHMLHGSLQTSDSTSYGLFSPNLVNEVNEAISTGQQAILFQNRRGYSPSLTCRSCGWTPRCTRCDVALTYHQQSQSLVCHYCGQVYKIPERCPQCEEENLRDQGCGTEKVEAVVKRTFPEGKTLRMDLDTTRSRKSYEEIINTFAEGKKNLLIGTQMVTKGLDFERVKVVGILYADQLLNRPDFRAYERAYQMLSQVAGRAGRRNGRGKVILQTFQPELPVVQQIVNGDYEGMYATEMEERTMFRFPPAVRLIYVFLKSPKESKVEVAARVMGDALRKELGDDLWGPEKPQVARVSLQYIRQLVVKVGPERNLDMVRRLLIGMRDWMANQEDLKGVNVYFDVDPM